jgi:hypothetical protein
MGFTNYASLRAEVSSWLDVSDVTVTSVDSIIQVGENYVNRKLRVEVMEAAIAVTINSAGVATLPSDFAEAQFLYLDRSPTAPLQPKSAEWIFRTYPDRAATGIPQFIAQTNSTFIFGPAPDTTDVVKGTYYAKPAQMATTSTIHSVFSEYPEIYLWAALANAELFLGRDQRMSWQMKCDEAIERANNDNRRRRFSGGPIAMSPG